MGRALLEAGSADAQATISAALDVSASAMIGRDAGELAAGAKGVSIGDDVAAAVAASDVLVDFTRPAGTLVHLAACRVARKAIVIGTTGFEAGEMAALREAARDIPIVFAPNFSIGVNVTLKLVDLAARALGPAYDVEVFEMHHKLKVDAASGTAL
jgi:4-hydroxy-tetrahydrodipicolinate reductase